jgi:cystathionine beta-lyase/cystathionine gamma-synthase
MSTPIQHSSTFAFPSLEAMDAAQALGRPAPTTSASGTRRCARARSGLAALEEAEMALLFPRGWRRSRRAFLAHVKAGDHIVALAQTYGGTRVMLEWGAARLGWSFDLVDAREPGSWERAFRANTRIFHVESPTNPVLCMVDLAAAAQLAHRPRRAAGRGQHRGVPARPASARARRGSRDAQRDQVDRRAR